MARGWAGAKTEATKAKDKVIRFGSGILAADSMSWGPYVLVSGERAAVAARAHLARQPAQEIVPVSLVQGDLDALVADPMPEVELVVGLGGGLALDASKFVSLTLDVPLVLVPSITSTGAIINSHWGQFSARGRISGAIDDWPWSDPEYILLDPDLVLGAPNHLNTAGLGDTLCWYAGLAEWRSDSRHGRGPSWDENGYATVVAKFQSIVDGFRRTLDTDSCLRGETLQFIVEILRDRWAFHLDLGLPKGDHAFERFMEIANDRSWVHGEVTALGSVVVTWAAGEPTDRLVRWLDDCQVRWRPLEQGITRDELRRGLEAAPTALPESGPYNWDTIIRREPVTGERFAQLWAFLNGASR